MSKLTIIKNLKSIKLREYKSYILIGYIYEQFMNFNYKPKKWFFQWNKENMFWRSTGKKISWIKKNWMFFLNIFVWKVERKLMVKIAQKFGCNYFSYNTALLRFSWVLFTIQKFSDESLQKLIWDQLNVSNLENKN